MILAVRHRQPPEPASLWEQVDAIKRFYGIAEQKLERLLREYPVRGQR